MAEKDIDLKKIKELIEVMKQNQLEELEIKHGEDKIFLKRCQPQSPLGPAITAFPVAGRDFAAPHAGTETAGKSAAPQSSGHEENLLEIKSPIVGTFYAKPSPDSEPYVEAGSPVDSQTVVCIIEAMKVMNEIKAETRGTIVEVLVADGQAVEYGQAMFKVRPE